MSRNSSTNQISMEELCMCGNPLVRKTSWSDANPGRRFLACEKDRNFGGCKKFIWVDPPACERCSQIIPGLLRNINSKESALKMLELKNLEMKKTILKLQITLVVGVVVILIYVFRGWFM